MSEESEICRTRGVRSRKSGLPEIVKDSEGAEGEMDSERFEEGDPCKQ